jgi:eukaryotic-like serine/threonine-protein kinase
MSDLKTALSVGELVANGYRILGMAGAGGMGVVYRALDLKLERTVALKFLPAELNASDRDKQRFLREARTASSLDHPNIGVIHGIEETPDGRTFIVMAFYEGQSLAQKIRNGPLTPAEALDIAIQMASGLAEAHARQIVHRDIKPSNVMLTGSGSVRIVDFGLAHAATGATASQTGMTGTVAYMSPEQALGNTVDQRSDIWSLGLVLAEMLTGRNPLERETIAAIIMAILNEAPQGLEALPPELAAIVYRALSKQPAKRYQQCAEMIADLEAVRALPAIAGAAAAAGAALPPSGKRTRQNAQVSRYMAEASRSAWSPEIPQRRNLRRWVEGALVLLVLAAAALLVPAVRETLFGGIAGAAEKHIAVLPFDNLGSNPETEVLVQGLMDSLAGKLSNLDVGNKSLWVVPTSEVRRRKITDPSEALKQLGATLTVQGSIEREGQAVHMNMSLIDTRKMRQVGSVEVEDQAGDLAALQNEAVSRLAKLMDVSVSAEMLKTTGGVANPAAYEGYLKALGYMQRYDKEGNLDQAIAALNQAVKTDPRFALGYAQLGEAYRLKYQVDKNPNWLQEAEANCRKAIELDKSLTSAYVTLGKVHNVTGKGDLALAEFQQALSINPRDAAAVGGLAPAYENAGNLPQAEAAFRRAAALQPNDWGTFNDLATFLEHHGKFADAIEQFKHALQITPDNAQVMSNLASAYIDSGDPKALPLAEQALLRSIALNPTYPAYVNLGVVYQDLGRYQDSIDATQKALALNQQNYLTWLSLVTDYEWLDKTKEAADARSHEIGLLEQAVKSQPQDVTANALLADAYSGQQEKAKAMARIETSLALAPNDPQTLASVADSYANLNERAQAIRYIGLALKNGLPAAQLRSDPELRAEISDPAVASLLRTK